MGIVELRADSLDAAFDAFGVDVELLVGATGEVSKAIQGIWTSPATETELGGFDLQSDRPSYILALKKADAPRITRGDRVRAKYGGRMQVFRVAAPAEIFSDHFRWALVVEPSSGAASGSSGKSEPDHPAPDRKPTDPPKTGPDPHQVKDHE